MRHRRSNIPQAAGKINVTPLIDVVMCLIVFYLIVGKLAAEKRAKVDLPESKVGAPEEAGGGPVVTIAAIGTDESSPVRVLVDGQDVTIDQLVGSLQARGAKGGPVQIRADRRLAYARVAPVLDACRRAGLTSVRLTTQRTGGNP
jgi:biopolymer transport protein ExbD